ncbi:hypothetical protein AO284_40725 [Pseudomonas sp. NZIPFR-PS2]|nr:hypothetical protein AO284_40725 [Pseudomonas sp. NZIPFR-PS2]
MRELGPINPAAPAFPTAGGALIPLKAKDEAGFSNLWSGQALRLGKDTTTYALTRELAEQALAKITP